MPKTEKLMLRALAGETLDTPPVWLMRQAGRYLPEYRETRTTAKNFLHFCYSPDLTVEAALQPLRRYPLDAAILFSDILVVPDALGQSVSFVEGEGPRLEPIRDATGIGGLAIDGVLDHLAPVYESVERLRAAIDKNTTLIGFAGAPWTVAVYMVEGRGGTDCANIRSWAYLDPDGFGELIDLIIEATVRHLGAQISNGVDVVQLFDSWAGVLSETQFRDWVIDPNRRLRERLRIEFPDIPVIGFPRGGGVLTTDYVRDTGVDGVSLDHTVPLGWVRDVLQPLATVQGTLDNRLLVAGGDAMDREVDRIREYLGSGPFIFNLGHGVVPETPPDHVARLISRIKA